MRAVADKVLKALDVQGFMANQAPEKPGAKSFVAELDAAVDAKVCESKKSPVDNEKPADSPKGADPGEQQEDPAVRETKAEPVVVSEAKAKPVAEEPAQDAEKVPKNEANPGALTCAQVAVLVKAPEPMPEVATEAGKPVADVAESSAKSVAQVVASLQGIVQPGSEKLPEVTPESEQVQQGEPAVENKPVVVAMEVEAAGAKEFVADKIQELELAKFVNDSNLELEVLPQKATEPQERLANSLEKLVHKVIAQDKSEEKPVAKPQEGEEVKAEPTKEAVAASESQVSEVDSQEEGSSFDEAGSETSFAAPQFEELQLINQSSDGTTEVKTVRVIAKQVVAEVERVIFSRTAPRAAEIKMNLNPKELGELLIKLVVENGKAVALTITAKNQNTKNLLANNVATLKQEFAKNGTELGKVEVTGSAANAGGNATESGQKQNQQRQKENYESLMFEELGESFALNMG